MIEIEITEKAENENNLLYVQSTVTEVISGAGGSAKIKDESGRKRLTIDCPICYEEIIKAEIKDRLAEIIAINYKYEFFRNNVKVTGLSDIEKEILYASLISADLTEDKKYAFERFVEIKETAIDGVYNFRLTALKKKWKEIVSFIPEVFVHEQLRDFITYLIENKKKRVYIDGGKVYDSHYRRLIRSRLLGGEEATITREVLMSGGGEVEISGEIPKDDENYLREFYGDKIYFSSGYSVKNR